MTVSGVLWTDEEKSRVLKLDREGRTASQIANAITLEFGVRRTRNAVIGVINRTGIRSGRELRAPSRRTTNEPLRPQSIRVAVPTPQPEPRSMTILRAPAAPVESEQKIIAIPFSTLDRGIPLNSLQAFQCRNIVGDRPHLYCGEPTVFGTSWCDACARRVFTAEGYQRLKARGNISSWSGHVA